MSWDLHTVGTFYKGRQIQSLGIKRNGTDRYHLVSDTGNARAGVNLGGHPTQTFHSAAGPAGGG